MTGLVFDRYKQYGPHTFTSIVKGESSNSQAQSSKPNILCNICNKKGHLKFECRLKFDKGKSILSEGVTYLNNVDS